jgi:hypothetical protein
VLDAGGVVIATANSTDPIPTTRLRSPRHRASTSTRPRVAPCQSSRSPGDRRSGRGLRAALAGPAWRHARKTRSVSVSARSTLVARTAVIPVARWKQVRGNDHGAQKSHLTAELR